MMRIVYIAAGAAGSYCGACARDVALCRGLIARGHDVLLVPLYTPLRSDTPMPRAERVFYGGINAWLQDRSRLFRKTPRFVDWLFDRPWLLNLASRAIETRPEKLGAMTVSVLRGADGRQRKELEKLIRFLESGPRPEVINLTNSLLSAVAPEIKRRLGAPLFCTLQGEESFVARLPQPYRDEAASLMRRHAQHFDRLFSPGETHADEMSEFLAVPRERIEVVRPGVEALRYRPAGGRVRAPFRIGFLSRVSPAKGLDILVEAFILLEKRRPGKDMVLSVAGEVSRSNSRFLARLRERIASAGLTERFEYHGEVGLEEKVRFLRSLSVFCLPSRYAEQRAMACLEAMAAGVPAVAPRLGLFPELIGLTGGGLLTPVEDPAAVAEALAALMDDPDRADQMGRAAAEGVARHFSSEAMTARTLAIYEDALKAQSKS
jgi:glycosyltransferase involved in cell wall biosynthesis